LQDRSNSLLIFFRIWFVKFIYRLLMTSKDCNHMLLMKKAFVSLSLKDSLKGYLKSNTIVTQAYWFFNLFLLSLILEKTNTSFPLIDFLEITEEYGPSTMNINKMKDLTFPLIRKPQSDNEINLLTFSDTDKKVMTVYVIAPDGTSSSTSKKDVIIDNNQENSLLIKINRVKGMKKYLLFVKLTALLFSKSNPNNSLINSHHFQSNNSSYSSLLFARNSRRLQNLR